MKHLIHTFFITLIILVFTTAGYAVITSLLDYTPKVEARSVYMGDYRGYNVTCSETPTLVKHANTKLISTCAKASFGSVRYDPKNRDRCLKNEYFGSASLYTWGMMFNVVSTIRSSHTCLRPA